MPLPRWTPLVLALVAACPHRTPSEPIPPHAGAPPPDAGRPVVASGPTAGECDALVDHAIELHLAELRRTQPPDRLPTGPELATLRAELRGDPGCPRLTRDAYRCAMAAGSLGDLAACGAPHP